LVRYTLQGKKQKTGLRLNQTTGDWHRGALADTSGVLTL
jgi:hypothetical protein